MDMKIAGVSFMNENFNYLLDNNKKRKSILLRTFSFVCALLVGILSFTLVYGPRDKVEAQSIPSYLATREVYGGIFNGFHLSSKGMLNFDGNLMGEIGGIDNNFNAVYNENCAQVITSVDMLATKTIYDSVTGIANVYYPLGTEDLSFHRLYQTLSTGDFAKNYYLYSYYCNSINIEMPTPRIVYIDSNLKSTPKLMIYSQIPSNIRLRGSNDNQYYYAYRFGFSYRDIYGDLQYIEIGDYTYAIYSTVYDNAIYFNLSEILSLLEETALKNNNCYLIEDMYFNTNLVYLSDNDLFFFNDEFSVPNEEKYRLLFPQKSPYDLNDKSDYAQYIKPYYTCDWVGSQYINIPLNTVTLETESIALMESSNMWLQYAYNDNMGVWSIFTQFFNIEIFPNFKISYLLIIGLGVLMLSIIYKFVIV